MPYNSTGDLPPEVKNKLPPHAQEIFVSAFNNAWEQYKDLDEKEREATAHKVAWGAVKQKYRKNVFGTGKAWVRK